MPDGTVRSFDADGWGIVTGTDDVDHPFHCTALTDGSRRIEPGVAVTYQLQAGRQGRWEATDVARR